MGPWLVLVSPCFREKCSCHMQNWVFLCSLDNLLQKNVIVLFFWKSNFKMALIWKKRAIFNLLFTFSSHQGEVTKIPSAHISLTYIHVFCSPYWLFCLTNFEKKYEFIRYAFSLVRVLVLILIRAILKQSTNNKMCPKLKSECLLLICTYTNEKFIVICKPRTLNDGRRWRFSKIQKSQKAPLLSSSHFAFYR